MKTNVLTQTEDAKADEWLKENAEELKEVGITESSLMKNINSFMKDAPQTKEFVARPKGSPLTDLIKFVKEVRDDLSQVECTNTKTIAMAIDKVLEKIEEYPYSIKEAALKRYMKILGLDYYFLLEFVKPSDKQEFDAIFAADNEAVQTDLEAGRAKYIKANTIEKCRNDKERNCSFKNKPMPIDFDEKTKEYYKLCTYILETMNIKVPRHELLLPKVCEAVLRENIEVMKAAEAQDEFYVQQTKEGEEVTPEFETTSGYRSVPKAEGKAFWVMRRERCFSEFNVLKITPIRGANLNDKKFTLIKNLTQELYDKILNSRDYTVEDFKKLYFI